MSRRIRTTLECGRASRRRRLPILGYDRNRNIRRARRIEPSPIRHVATISQAGRPSGRRGSPPPRRRRPAREELEALGAVPLRAAVGHGARGLLGRRATAGTTSPHDHARSRAYRWGEDGLLGITDRECRLCFALALWNGRDPILKERLFGLTGPEGNHGEDVKECYYYLDSHADALVPEGALQVSAGRVSLRAAGRGEPPPRQARAASSSWSTPACSTTTATSTSFAEYAKASPDDMLIRITVANRGPEAATLHLLPTLWFRNTWSWGCTHEGCWRKPRDRAATDERVAAPSTRRSGDFGSGVDAGADGQPPTLLFTENETNVAAALRRAEREPVREGRVPRVRRRRRRRRGESRRGGTKAAAHYRLDDARRRRGHAFACGSSPRAKRPREPFGDELRRDRSPSASPRPTSSTPRVMPADADRRASAASRGRPTPACCGRKQFYHYVVDDWLDGDPDAAAAARRRARQGRNATGAHLYNRDVISMPDKWEYPWYAAWDLAFHMIPFARIDPRVRQGAARAASCASGTCTRTASSRPTSSRFGDVNPPVHAWACWRVYKMTGARGERDRRLPRARASRSCCSTSPGGSTARTPRASNLFSGGFLGLDNIGVFDRSQPLPDRRPPRAGRRHGVDGVLLRARCCRWRSSWPRTTRPTRTWPRSSSSTSSPSPTP